MRNALLVAMLIAFVSSAVLAQNPNRLAVDVRNPFSSAAENHTDAQWCAPNHWKPWLGDWACDVWVDNGTADINFSLACGKPVYLKVSPSTLSAGMVPDKVRAKVVYTSTACANGQYSSGGYAQKYQIYATYRGVEVDLGWVLFAHLDNLVYSTGQWIEDPMNTYVGTTFSGSTYSNCWGSCHVHVEFYNNSGWACWQNLAPGRTGIPAWGKSSIMGKLGGALSGAAGQCPVCSNEESLACSTWDNDLGGCDAKGLYDSNPANDTQDCAYFLATNKCRPRGTPNCLGGLTAFCSSTNSETFACSTWDGNVTACDQHGLYDPNRSDDTQDCAYHFDTGRCLSRGTSNCATGCTWCWDCTSCPQ